jgi:hypothetical protein
MMQPESALRRQVYLLTVKELMKHTIWEFCLGEEDIPGQDEATVKPSEDSEVPGYSPGAYVIAADVTFADGTSALGYLYSGEPNDWGCIQPNAVTQAGQVNFWLGALRFVADVDKRIADQLQVLGRSARQIFPAIFKSRAKINDEFQTVIVSGFMALEGDGSVKILSR